ncbi:MAG: methyltransferase domain-containing protein [Clostridium sp.]|nr:methyltransferase domain-containing protein [Clostridium sp.]
MHIAEKLGERGKVISRDISEYKVSMLRDNIERMGYKNIEVQEYDACILDESLVEKVDIVTADLPCSGLGVIGKKRDIKYRVSQETIEEVEELQRKILGTVWQYVKPGGILIYSTCTMNPGENEKMVKWFTDNYPFERESLAPYLPEELKAEGEEGMLQLFPGEHKTDGFFLARLRKHEGTL